MIVCDDFVFLHLHKSGGTFVNQLMLKCLPSAKRIGYHLPYKALPEAYRSLPVLGTVRNPWSYYVSWFHFQQAQKQPNALFRMASENGEQGFTETIKTLVTLADDLARIERLASEFPDDYQGYGLNLTKACITALAGQGLGFYTYLHDRMYEGAPDLTVIQMDNLRDDISRFPGMRDQPAQDLIQLFLQAAPRFNTSEHGPYQDYYTPELRDLVARRDARLIEVYSYKF